MLAAMFAIVFVVMLAAVLPTGGNGHVVSNGFVGVNNGLLGTLQKGLAKWENRCSRQKKVSNNNDTHLDTSLSGM